MQDSQIITSEMQADGTSERAMTVARKRGERSRAETAREEKKKTWGQRAARKLMRGDLAPRRTLLTVLRAIGTRVSSGDSYDITRGSESELEPGEAGGREKTGRGKGSVLKGEGADRVDREEVVLVRLERHFV